ncbi:MAG: hypothetical protein IJ065_11270 [Eubacterium sp.]|nr:hypothetical protein [Eubacterium sp.]
MRFKKLLSAALSLMLILCMSACSDEDVHIPLERNSLSAIAGRLSATNGKFKYLYWIAHVLSV